MKFRTIVLSTTVLLAALVLWSKRVGKPPPLEPALPVTGSSVASPELFPATPTSPNEFITQDFQLSDLSDEALVDIFENKEGKEWSAALKELKTRKTATCVTALVRNIDQVRSISIVNAAVMATNPESGFPVAQALIDCRPEAAAELMAAIADRGNNMRKRLLPFLILFPSGRTEEQPLEASKQFLAHLNTDAERAAFLEIGGIANSAEILASFFPLDAPIPVDLSSGSQ